jgi:hypothetical protein
LALRNSKWWVFVELVFIAGVDATPLATLPANVREYMPVPVFFVFIGAATGVCDSRAIWARFEQGSRRARFELGSSHGGVGSSTGP